MRQVITVHLKLRRSKCCVAIIIEEDIFLCYRGELFQRRAHSSRVNSRLSSGNFSCPIQERRLKILQRPMQCRQTKAKVSNLTNYKGRRQFSEPIKTPSKCTQQTRMAGKRLQESLGFGFNFDWMKTWHEFFKQITQRCNAKSVTFRYSRENTLRQGCL